MNSMLSEILLDASYAFIIIGSFFALLFGLSLIFTPKATLKFNQKMNTRFSLRKATKKIETAIKSEPLFYKHSKISGALLIIGSTFVLYTLITFNPYLIIPYLPKSISPPAWEWIINSAQIFFTITCSFIFIFGLIVFIRPSLVKHFEQAANHWISTRQGFSKMTKDIDTTNKLVNAYPRIFGVFVTIFALVILFLLLPPINT